VLCYRGDFMSVENLRKWHDFIAMNSFPAKAMHPLRVNRIWSLLWWSILRAAMWRPIGGVAGNDLMRTCTSLVWWKTTVRVRYNIALWHHDVTALGGGTQGHRLIHYVIMAVTSITLNYLSILRARRHMPLDVCCASCHHPFDCVKSDSILSFLWGKNKKSMLMRTRQTKYV
jgi:hypothetical protein